MTHKLTVAQVSVLRHQEPDLALNQQARERDSLYHICRQLCLKLRCLPSVAVLLDDALTPPLSNSQNPTAGPFDTNSIAFGCLPPIMPTDPVTQMWRFVQKGAGLCALLNCFPDTSYVPPVNTDDVKLRKKNLYNFLRVCKTDLRLHDDELFTISDALSGSTSHLLLVLTTLQLVVARLEALGIIPLGLKEPNGSFDTSSSEIISGSGTGSGTGSVSVTNSTTSLASRSASVSGSSGSSGSLGSSGTLATSPSGSVSVSPVPASLPPILRELLTTERKYVQDLQTMLQYKSQLQSQDALPSPALETLFPGLPELLDFQRRFLLGLEIQAELPPANQRIGSVFLHCASEFTRNLQFLINQKAAYDIIDRETAVFNNTELKIQSGYELRAFLMKPVQRFLKYPLLLRELRKATPPDWPYAEELNVALKSVKNVAETLNEKQRELENEALAGQLRSRVRDWRSLDVGRAGKLLLHGILPFVRREHSDFDAEVFLFEECLLVCQRVAESGAESGGSGAISGENGNIGTTNGGHPPLSATNSSSSVKTSKLPKLSGLGKKLSSGSGPNRHNGSPVTPKGPPLLDLKSVVSLLDIRSVEKEAVAGVGSGVGTAGSTNSATSVSLGNGGTATGGGLLVVRFEINRKSSAYRFRFRHEEPLLRWHTALQEQARKRRAEEEERRAARKAAREAAARPSFVSPTRSPDEPLVAAVASLQLESPMATTRVAGHRHNSSNFDFPSPENIGTPSSIGSGGGSGNAGNNGTFATTKTGSELPELPELPGHRKVVSGGSGVGNAFVPGASNPGSAFRSFTAPLSINTALPGQHTGHPHSAFPGMAPTSGFSSNSTGNSDGYYESFRPLTPPPGPSAALPRIRSASSPNVRAGQNRAAESATPLPPLPRVPPVPGNSTIPTGHRSRKSDSGSGSGVSLADGFRVHPAQNLSALTQRPPPPLPVPIVPSVAQSGSSTPQTESVTRSGVSQLLVSIISNSDRLTLIIDRGVSYNDFVVQVIKKLQRSCKLPANLEPSEVKVKLQYLDDDDLILIQNDEDLSLALEDSPGNPEITVTVTQ